MLVILLNDSGGRQAVIQCSQGGNGTVAKPRYPNPCPFTWVCKTPLG
jgi:hypothetical protein